MVMVDYSKLSAKLNIPLWKFEVAMGRPIKECLAKTPEEADTMYSAATEGSEEEVAAELKGDALILQLLPTVTSAKRAEEFFYIASFNSSAEKAAFLKRVELASTAEEVRQAAVNSPNGSGEIGLVAVTKFIEVAAILDEAVEAYFLAYDYGIEVELAAVRKIIKLYGSFADTD
jgi:hypothetical protein